MRWLISWAQWIFSSCNMIFRKDSECMVHVVLHSSMYRNTYSYMFFLGEGLLGPTPDFVPSPVSPRRPTAPSAQGKEIVWVSKSDGNNDSIHVTEVIVML